MRSIAAHVNAAFQSHPLAQDAEILPFTDPHNHHHMLHDKHHYVDIGELLHQHPGDPALKVGSHMPLCICHTLFVSGLLCAAARAHSWASAGAQV